MFMSLELQTQLEGLARDDVGKMRMMFFHGGSMISLLRRIDTVWLHESQQESKKTQPKNSGHVTKHLRFSGHSVWGVENERFQTRSKHLTTALGSAGSFCQQGWQFPGRQLPP